MQKNPADAGSRWMPLASPSRTTPAAAKTKVLTVTFPDLAVGDSIVLKTRESMRPDGSGPDYADFFVADGVVAQSIRVVASRAVRLSVTAGHGFDHAVTDDETTATHVLVHRAAQQSPGSTAPGAVKTFASAFPISIITILQSHEEIGRGLWSVIGDKARVTTEIDALAQEITEGIAGRRAQAEAIDRWVKRNIRYLALQIDLTAGLPHDAETVLRNRAGDCKEHAILMSALLAAKAIASELVMINAARMYALEAPGVPVFDHMILYLPEFGSMTTRPTRTHRSACSRCKPTTSGARMGARAAAHARQVR